MEITVRSGDSLWYYSQLFGLPLQLINDSNPEINPSQITPGQNLEIPGFLTENYVIKNGDTLWNISQSRNLSVDALLLLNTALNPDSLQTGQIIRLPIRVTWRIVSRKRSYDYEKLLEDLNKLAAIYPFMIRRSIGNSVMGKEIPELRIGKGPKKVHVNGSFHANEWITTPIIMKFINDYLLSITNYAPIRGLQLGSFYNSVMLSTVPMVNPDGVNLVLQGLPEREPFRSSVLQINNESLDFSDWKANIRGVDLNNQFQARWEIEAERKPQSPAPRDYPGPEPLSEPEAKAMAVLTNESEFARVNAFHTQGEVIFWGFEGEEPLVAETIVNEYSRVSGYEPIQYVDSYAGYKDWSIQEWNRPGYTIELGMGTNPLPISQFDEIYQESLGIFLANLYM